MKKVVIFEAGKIGRRCLNNPNRDYEIVAVLDNYKDSKGYFFDKDIPIIGIDEYKNCYKEYEIIIAIHDFHGVEEQLKKQGILNYRISGEIYVDPNVPFDIDVSHDNWKSYLSENFNKEGIEVLEIGSRNVTGTLLRDKFSKANYVGFDYYPGENVDVVGDDHELSNFFDRKFDLIFSSAVFEHLAMPWKVSTEIVKLLKVGGHVFIETHYSFSSHERPWHFSQFSENALDVLFPEKFGMHCIKKGCFNLIEGKFSEYSSEYLVGKTVDGLYCHSEYLGIKTKEVKSLSWDDLHLADVVKATEYPRSERK